MARGIWFQICGAAEEKARWPNSVFVVGMFIRTEQTTGMAISK